jgi:molybdopterin-guanine dinucleotide biosynthesis protein
MFLYDAEIVNGKATLTTIRVLEESIVEGASVPTYKIQYPDGRVARVSRDMYQVSEEAALQKLLKDTEAALEYAKEEERKAEKEVERLSKEFVLALRLQRK